MARKHDITSMSRRRFLQGAAATVSGAALPAGIMAETLLSSASEALTATPVASLISLMRHYTTCATGNKMLHLLSYRFLPMENVFPDFSSMTGSIDDKCETLLTKLITDSAASMTIEQQYQALLRAAADNNSWWNNLAPNLKDAAIQGEEYAMNEDNLNSHGFTLQQGRNMLGFLAEAMQSGHGFQDYEPDNEHNGLCPFWCEDRAYGTTHKGLSVDFNDLAGYVRYHFDWVMNDVLELLSRNVNQFYQKQMPQSVEMLVRYVIDRSGVPPQMISHDLYERMVRPYMPEKDYAQFVQETEQWQRLENIERDHWDLSTSLEATNAAITHLPRVSDDGRISLGRRDSWHIAVNKDDPNYAEWLATIEKHLQKLSWLAFPSERGAIIAHPEAGEIDLIDPPKTIIDVLSTMAEHPRNAAHDKALGI